MIIAGLALFIIVPFFFLWNEFSNLSTARTINTDKFSSYGSILSGLVGTIWSLASVILFYVALREQRKDMEVNKVALGVQTDALKQQVAEFELQRAELAETRKVYIEQSKTQSLQRFENTFFQVVDLHIAIVNAIRLPGGVYQGRTSFKVLNDSVGNHFKSIPDMKPMPYYTELFHGNQESFSHYFRNVYHLLKLIDRTEIEGKEFYAGLFRAQLSAHELSLIFYFGLTPAGRELKVLIEEYEIFRDVNIGNIHVTGEGVFMIYQPTAFGHNTYDFLRDYRSSRQQN